MRVSLIQHGAVATELAQSHPQEATRHDAQQLYDQVQSTAEDIAEVVAFVVGRPTHLAIHEVLLRPAGQP